MHVSITENDGSYNKKIQSKLVVLNVFAHGTLRLEREDSSEFTFYSNCLKTIKYHGLKFKSVDECRQFFESI